MKAGKKVLRTAKKEKKTILTDDALNNALDNEVNHSNFFCHCFSTIDNLEVFLAGFFLSLVYEHLYFMLQYAY